MAQVNPHSKPRWPGQTYDTALSSIHETTLGALLALQRDEQL